VQNEFPIANNDFPQSHLTPMITLQNHCENQISREAPSAMIAPPQGENHPFGQLALGHLLIPNKRPKST
jgi:hypothetical protein